jgi:fluoride exporter
VNVLIWLGVALLGGVGAVLRFSVDGLISARSSGVFPHGTLAVNVSGAMLLGLLGGLALDERVALLAGTALIGSYTTFSTWMFETQRLAEDRQQARSAANIVGSLALGLAAAALGAVVGTAL